MRIQSFIDEDKRPYPFCPGCSHGRVLDRLNEALLSMDVVHTDVVIVTDIGCVGLSDQWFVTHAFHGLHGRSVLYGEGLRLADTSLHVVVLMGDGGAGVGLHHLISAARRNINITVLIFNNFNFGMTGGEHSVTTPLGSSTATTRSGNSEIPANIIDTMIVNGAPFAARRVFSDSDLADILKTGISFDGFAIIEIFEFCTAYFTMANRFGKKAMETTLEETGFQRTLEINENRTEYSRAITDTALPSQSKQTPKRLYEPCFQASIKDKLNIVLAGSAGQKIQSTASLLAGAAILSGLSAIQRDDYPVTVKSGHSLAFLNLTKTPTEFIDTSVPGALFILSIDGLSKSHFLLKKLTESSYVYILDNLPEIDTIATEIRVDLSRLETRIPTERIPLAVLTAWLKQTSVLPIESLKKAAEINYGEVSASGLSKLMDSVPTEVLI